LAAATLIQVSTWAAVGLGLKWVVWVVQLQYGLNQPAAHQFFTISLTKDFMSTGPNVDPIYSHQGNISGALIGGTANTNSDGTGTVGTNMTRLFLADSVNGSYVQRVRFSPSATTAATATSATVIRVYISSITSGVTSPGNNIWLWQEVASPAQTADQTTTATNFIEVPLNFILPAGWTIMASSHIVNAANTSWTGVVIAGNY